MKQRKLQNIFLKAGAVLIALIFSISIHAQNNQQARKILDKTAAIIGNKAGASANFTYSHPKLGKTNGSIAIKGAKFYARTPQATVWFDGKTQWSYLKQTNEVNISSPSHTQQVSMNPYTFIYMYKSGYQLYSKTVGNNYQIRMVAQNKRSSISEMYILINKRSYIPAQIKIKQGNQWSTIQVRNFRTKNLPNNLFVFKSRDFPSAEVIDLR